MGFEIVDSSGNFLDALLIVIAISAAIPVAIYFVLAVARARHDVLHDRDHDFEA